MTNNSTHDTASSSEEILIRHILMKASGPIFKSTQRWQLGSSKYVFHNPVEVIRMSDNEKLFWLAHDGAWVNRISDEYGNLPFGDFLSVHDTNFYRQYSLLF